MKILTARREDRAARADVLAGLARAAYDAANKAVTAARAAALAEAEAGTAAPCWGTVQAADDLTRQLEAARRDAQAVIRDWSARALPFARDPWEDALARMDEAARAAGQLVTGQP